MKIKINEYMSNIDGEKFTKTNLDISKEDILQGDSWAIEKSKEQLVKDMKNNTLSQVLIHVVDAEFEINFTLETSVINLPFSDANKVIHFFDAEQEVDTKIYLSTYCDYLNASKFHIDLITENEISDAEQKNILTIMKQNYEASQTNFENKDEVAEGEK